ncbi:hypothetical protein D1007_26667 [Hordeum vulgare]|nr:hypothetical protein D1007_26667 [Hordeum vulgare]
MVGPVRTGSPPHDPSWGLNGVLGYRGGHRPLLAPHSRPSFPQPRERDKLTFVSVLAVVRTIAANPLELSPPAAMSSGTIKKGQHNGAWLGCDICDGHIHALRHRRMLPPAFFVAVRIPAAETAPTPREGEIVVFDEHLYKGFGFPASNFFATFLNFFGLQPYHQAPNAILQLASFVVLCEGFMGIEPCPDLWQSVFFFNQQSTKMDKAEAEKLTGPRPMTPCGAALVHHRTKCGCPQMPLQDSIKQWQRRFFYMKNANPSLDAIKMPPFSIDPPTMKKNWLAKYLSR